MRWHWKKDVIHSGASLLDDRPIFSLRKITAKNGDAVEHWSPQNHQGIYRDQIPVREALAFSHNLAAIQLARKLGMSQLQAGFRRFFFPNDRKQQTAALAKRQRFRADESIAIGSLEMRPIEMALAYSAFANNGRIANPHLILSIHSSDGQELYAAPQAKERKRTAVMRKQKIALSDTIEFSYLQRSGVKRVIGGDTAEIMIDLLRSAAGHAGVQRGGYKRHDFVGKTGTSNDYRDAWFVGVRPDITAAVWVGFDDASFGMPGGRCGAFGRPTLGRYHAAQSCC